MKTKYLLLVLLSVISINAFSAVDSHDPRGRKHRGNHAHRVVVVPPPARVLVMPPPRVYMVPPPPRHVHVVVSKPVRNHVSTNEAIRNAKGAISRQRFEADKLRIAKDVAADLPLRSIDILDIMNLFNFESSKLEFAKFAYDRAVDPGNYSIVFEAFKYTSSIQHLEDYIYNER